MWVDNQLINFDQYSLGIPGVEAHSVPETGWYRRWERGFVEPGSPPCAFDAGISYTLCATENADLRLYAEERTGISREEIRNRTHWFDPYAIQVRHWNSDPGCGE
jgi:hypothetical protein